MIRLLIFLVMMQEDFDKPVLNNPLGSFITFDTPQRYRFYVVLKTKN